MTGHEWLTAKSLYEKLWLAPVYDENGQLNTHDGLIAYTLTPAGLDMLATHFGKVAPPEEYTRAQEMFDRALQFDPVTRARWDRRFQTLKALMDAASAAEFDPSEKGGLTSAELAQRLGISEQEAANELQILRDLGMIDGPQ